MSEAAIESFQRKHQTDLVTLVFTDLVASTELKRTLGEREAIGLIQQHRKVVRELLGEFQEAEEIETAGDSFLLIFTKPSTAVKFALMLQINLGTSAASKIGIQTRIGIHVGEVFVEQNQGGSKPKDLFGIQVDTCSRVVGLAGPNQILMTRFAFDNARSVLRGEELVGICELGWFNHGRYLFKGLEEPLEVCEVRIGAAGPATPPASSEKAQRCAPVESEPIIGWRPALGQAVPGTEWVLEEKLGEGGFGEVWLAIQRRLKTRRVLKFCFQAERVRALKREATLFRLLKERTGEHPNIVRLLDVFFEEPPFYIAEEYVEGKDLQHWCHQRGGADKIPLEVRLEIIAQGADGLQAAHDAGVIHRDVKPGNILMGGQLSVTNPPDGGPPVGSGPCSLVVKLTDFGIAQVVSSDVFGAMTRAGFTRTSLGSGTSNIGTHMYMAPEIFAGKAASIRSDVYSLGVVLYQLVVGDLSSPLTTDWANHISDPLLRDDLKNCFAGNPQDRFSGAGQLAKSLRTLKQRHAALAEHQAVLSARERAAYRHGAMRTAAKASVIIAALLLLALVAFQQSRLATRYGRETRAEFVRLNVAYGTRLMDEGDFLGSLPPLIQALKLAEGTPEEQIHRTRIGLVLRQCPKLTQVLSHKDQVNSAQFSPDGTRILTASSDGTAAVWDLLSGAPVIPPLQHGGSVTFAAFSPDGNRIVTTGSDSAARIWEAASGRMLTPPLRPHGEVTCAAFSPDGHWVATASKDHTARLWDARTGQPATPPLEQSNEVSQVNFSPDSRSFVTACEKGDSRVWDVDSGQLLFPPMLHAGGVVRARFSCDGKRILTAGFTDSSGQVWDARTGKKLGGPLSHSTWVADAQFSPDGRLAITTSFDNTARVWDVTSGMKILPDLKHPHSVMEGCFSADGRRLATACFNQSAFIWNALTGELEGSQLKHSRYLSHVAFSPDGRTVLAVPADGSVRVWDLATGSRASVSLEHDGHVNLAQFSPDGRLVATASQDQTAKVWDAATFQLVCPPLRHRGSVTSVGFSPDGGEILTASEDKTARRWDWRTGQPKGLPLTSDNPIILANYSADGRRIFIGSKSGQTGEVARVWDAIANRPISPPIRSPKPVSCVAFNSDGSKVLLGGPDGLAQIWDTASGKEVSPMMKHQSGVNDVQFSPDGRSIVTSCSDESFAELYAQIWDVTTGKTIGPRLRHKDGVLSAMFSPDGHYVVTASEDGSAGIWDARTGRLAVPLLYHRYQVLYAAFSPNGRFVVTASLDRSARIWDARTGEPVSPPLTHSERVCYAAFSPDGSKLVTCGWDGKAHLWDLSKEERPIQDLEHIAELLSCRSASASAGLVALEPSQLAQLWQQLHVRYPSSFKISEQDLIGWHQHEADACLKAGLWKFALTHLDELVKWGWNDALVSQRRVRAQSELDKASGFK